MTPPNMVTLFRIATAPFLIWILMHTGPSAAWLAAGVFFIATISDFFDGYLARSYDYVTTLGKFLDPMADKLVVTTALIMLAGMARSPHVPAWMVVVLVTREIMVTGLRAVAAAEGLIVAAEELGKYKMALQAIARLAICPLWAIQIFLTLRIETKVPEIRLEAESQNSCR